MKKIISFLAFALFAISIYTSLLSPNANKTANLFEFILLSSAQAEYEDDLKETIYQGTECCTNDEGCEECVTTVTTRCWLPGGGCTPDWHQDVYIVCP